MGKVRVKLIGMGMDQRRRDLSSLERRRKEGRHKEMEVQINTVEKKMEILKGDRIK